MAGSVPIPVLGSSEPLRPSDRHLRQELAQEQRRSLSRSCSVDERRRQLPHWVCEAKVQSVRSVEESVASSLPSRLVRSKRSQQAIALDYLAAPVLLLMAQIATADDGVPEGHIVVEAAAVSAIALPQGREHP